MIIIDVYGIIYKIKNNIDGKIYIGQTINKKGFKGRYHYGGNTAIERVYNHHLYKESHNYSFNVRLLEAIEKYGFEAFEVNEKFDVAYSKEELNTKENYWILKYNSSNWRYGYNIIGEKNINKFLYINNKIYNKQESRGCKGIKIICITTGNIFNNLKEGSLFYNISSCNISRCCNSRRNYCGKLSDGTKLKWMYYDEYLRLYNKKIA